MEEKLELSKKIISNLLGIQVYTFPITRGMIYDSLSQTFFYPEQLFSNSKVFEEFISELKEITIYNIKDNLDIEYCMITIKGWLFMIGPYLTQEIRKFDINKKLEKNNIYLQLSDELLKYYRSLKIINKETIIASAQTLISEFYPESLKAPETEIKTSGSLDDIFKKTSKKNIADEFIQKTYDFETQFMEKISQGDATEAKRLIMLISKRSEASNEITDISQTSFQMAYEGHAIARTLTRIAAKNMGVPSASINAITSADRQAANQATKASELDRIIFQTIDDVCTLVLRYRLLQYSPLIKRTIQYVISNLEHPLTVQEISEQVGVSANYLSGQFKSEMEITLTEYIRAQRLESASKLLKYSSMEIQEICSCIGVHDSNYFAKLFKDHYGMSPSAYRRNPMELSQH